MKRLLTLFTLLTITFSISAQTIIRGSDTMDGELQKGYYFLVKIDDKSLEKEWKDYLNSFGRLKEPENRRYSLSNLKYDKISNNNVRLESKLSGYSNFSKIFCVVKDTELDQYDERALEDFLLDFVAKAQYNEMARLAAFDLEEAENILSDVSRDKKKIERDLENNLKTQEKYGKYLDQSPQQLVSLLDAKQSIVDKQVGSNLDEDAASNLQKEAKRKEKEISRNQSKEKKYAKRLDKKEREFDELKTELFDMKKTVALAESLVFAKKQSLDDLKKK